MDMKLKFTPKSQGHHLPLAHLYVHLFYSRLVLFWKNGFNERTRDQLTLTWHPSPASFFWGKIKIKKKGLMFLVSRQPVETNLDRRFDYPKPTYTRHKTLWESTGVLPPQLLIIRRAWTRNVHYDGQRNTNWRPTKLRKEGLLVKADRRCRVHLDFSRTSFLARCVFILFYFFHTTCLPHLIFVTFFLTSYTWLYSPNRMTPTWTFSITTFCWFRTWRRQSVSHFRINYPLSLSFDFWLSIVTFFNRIPDVYIKIISNRKIRRK